MPWLRWLLASLSIQRPMFSPRPVYVGFVVDKVALALGFLQIFLFSPITTIAPMLHTHSFITDTLQC